MVPCELRNPVEVAVKAGVLAHRVASALEHGCELACGESGRRRLLRPRPTPTLEPIHRARTDHRHQRSARRDRPRPNPLFWANPGRSAITAAFSTAAASHARRAFFRVRRHWDRRRRQSCGGIRPVRRSCWSMGAVCTHRRYDVRMPKVIQIRDVPDEVRDALAQAADAEGLSLTGYVRRELEHLARRSQRVRDNAAVVRRTQSEVGARIDRDLILSELHEGRRD